MHVSVKTIETHQMRMKEKLALAYRRRVATKSPGMAGEVCREPDTRRSGSCISSAERGRKSRRITQPAGLLRKSYQSKHATASPSDRVEIAFATINGKKAEAEPGTYPRGSVR